jgi:glutathione S-transferase
MKNNHKMLELYQFEECPYCKSVRTAMTDLELSYIIHNVSRDKNNRTKLEDISNQKFVPVLVDPNTDTIIADDDEKIIEYLKTKYASEKDSH